MTIRAYKQQIFPNAKQKLPKQFTCELCEKSVPNKNRLKNPKYCSRECQAKASSIKATLHLVCQCCGKDFTRLQSALLRISGKYCSNSCAKKGDLNPRFKGGYKRKDGYHWICINGKCVNRARYVMEQHLGRSLFAGENVHHINGIRDDDRIENLELWSKVQPPGQRVDDKINWAIEILKQYGYEISKTVHERDLNASKNILAEGLRITGRTRESDKDVKNCVDFSALASVLNGSETEEEEARIVGEPTIPYGTELRGA